MNIKFKSWHISLLGVICFGFYFIPIIVNDYIECNQRYCDSGLHILIEFFFILIIVLYITPVILLGINKNANRKKTGLLWFFSVILLILTISPMLLIYPLNIILIPFVFLSCLIIIFDNIRRAIGAYLSIFLGVIVLFSQYRGNIQEGVKVEMVLVVSSVLFLSAGFLFFTKENKTK